MMNIIYTRNESMRWNQLIEICKMVSIVLESERIERRIWTNRNEMEKNLKKRIPEIGQYAPIGRLLTQKSTETGIDSQFDANSVFIKHSRHEFEYVRD